MSQSERARDRQKLWSRTEERRAPVQGREAYDLLDASGCAIELVENLRIVPPGEVAEVAVRVVSDLVSLVDQARQCPLAVIAGYRATQDKECRVPFVAREVVEDRIRPVGRPVVEGQCQAFHGLVREIVSAERLQQANSYLAIACYAAFPLGAALGGTIVTTVGSGTALMFDGATYAASAILLLFVRVESLARAGSGVLREMREGWSAFVEHQWVWVLCLWIALYFLLTYAPFFVLGPYIAKQSLGGAALWGVVVTGEGIGALLGSFAGLRLRPQKPLVSPWIQVCRPAVPIAVDTLDKALRIDTSQVENVLPASARSPGLRQA